MANITEKQNTSENSNLPENRIAALDIGSNSFHFIYARVIDNNIQILHSEKYRVKLAQGLNEQDELDDEAIQRGVEALTNIANVTNKLTQENFRVVATFTLRQARNAKKFIKAASKVFPFDIEIISGHEEARLIYQGVAHNTVPNTQRLVIDIGGGSTECVIGKDFQSKHLTSLNIGCVSFAQRHFPQGSLTKQAFNNATLDAKQEIEDHVKRFKKAGWQQALGTSGTLKSIYNIINSEADQPTPITFSALQKLKKQLISFKHTDNIDINSLKENRRQILAPGIAILIGICEMLEIETIDYCDYSLREGVLSELIEQRELLKPPTLFEPEHQDKTKSNTKNKHSNKAIFSDVRDRTINSLAMRFNVDQYQVDNVSSIAQQLIKQTGTEWGVEKKTYAKLLFWAINIHEIGFDINPSAHHKHAKYIILNADLPGFNVEQQQALAWLVGNQRKKIQLNDNFISYLLNEKTLLKLTALLRLSILLGQYRQLTDQISFNINVNKEDINLVFPADWLQEHSLFYADLQQEQKQLKLLDLTLQI